MNTGLMTRKSRTKNIFPQIRKMNKNIISEDVNERNNWSGHPRTEHSKHGSIENGTSICLGFEWSFGQVIYVTEMGER